VDFTTGAVVEHSISGMVVKFTTGLVVESSTSPKECFTTVVVETAAGESVSFVFFFFFFSIARPAVDFTTAAVMEHSISGMVVDFTTGLVVESYVVLYHRSGGDHRVNSLLSSFCSNKPHGQLYTSIRACLCSRLVYDLYVDV